MLPVRFVDLRAFATRLGGFDYIGPGHNGPNPTAQVAT